MRNLRTPDTADGSDREQITRLLQQNDLLKSQLMNTSLINDLTKIMHSTTDPDNIINTILLGIQEIVEFDRIILFEIDKDNFQLRPKARVGASDSDIDHLAMPLGFEGGDITDALFLNRHLIVEETTPQDDLFARKLGSRSYLVMPLVGKIVRKCWKARGCKNNSCPAYESYNPYCWSVAGAGNTESMGSEDERRRRCIACSNFKAQGVFWMDRTDNASPITSDNITAVSSIINQAGIIIENFQMFSALEVANSGLQEANSELTRVNEDLNLAHQKINRDLDHARTIQEGLLPRDVPNTPSFSASARYIPADAVGGDYYDVFEISPGTFGIVIADVSGHGVSSSLIMSMVKVLLKTFSGKQSGPQKTLERINTTLQTEVRTDNFVTVFYGILNTREHELHYTSAGHCPAIFLNRTTKACTQVKADGLFLGVFPDMMLNESTYPYTPGTQRIVLYTDGLTEAKNASDEMFELARLTEISVGTLEETPDKVVERILKEHVKFCGERYPPEDDITLLVLDF